MADDDPATYPIGQPFPGVIGRTLGDSEPAWPVFPTAAPGTPNVVIFVLDDVGFGQLGPFGGLIDTPVLDRLAGRGLRYTNFQTTALCSPTRGCLLSGRNHHALGLSAITDFSMGYPAHDAKVGHEHGFISEMLKDRGFATFATGKWHLTPPEDLTPAGPYDRWPCGRGFERYYGFIQADSSQWYPDLTYDNHCVMPPKTPEEGYHLNADIADHAIEFIRDSIVVRPDKPFFLYYATGAGHAPHHVEPEWIERYKGTFDMGWDTYREIVCERQIEMGIVPPGTQPSPRDPDVTPWDDHSDAEKAIYAHQMEVYAGFISQTDHHFGRVLDFVENAGKLDDTIVIAVSDNGASAEGEHHGTPNESLLFNRVEQTSEITEQFIDRWGSPDTFPHYAWGWAWAGDTPFRRWKRETYRGGITDPCIVSWPAGIDARGETRDQYTHAIDVVPTLLDVLGYDAPDAIKGVEQSPIHGVSFAHTFGDAGAPSRHETQYSEMVGHRAIYDRGWKAICPFPGPSLSEGEANGRVPWMTVIDDAMLADMDANEWELYNLDDDPVEVNDLAAAQPERLREMIELWYSEAERHGALPLAAMDFMRLTAWRPSRELARQEMVLYPGGGQIQPAAVPRVFNIAHTITAEVDAPPGAEGALVAQGSRYGGFCFFVKGGRLHYAYNYVGLDVFHVESNVEVPAGAATLAYEFEPTGDANPFAGVGAPGVARLYINGEQAGETQFDKTVPIMFAYGGLTCGYDGPDAIAPELYTAPFRYSGTIRRAVIDTSEEPTIDHEMDYRRASSQQ